MGRAAVYAAALLSLSALGCGNSAANAGGYDASIDASETSVPCFGCGDASYSDAPVTVQVKGVVDAVCGNPDGCHGGGVGGMGIHTNAEFDAMINVTSLENPMLKRVLPGQPEESYVYLKVACEGGVILSCMPPGAHSDRTAALFKAWIEAGAPTQ
jgi:hypothetical protein